MKLLTHQKPKVIHHRYLMNGKPQNCAFCNEPLKGEIWRKGEQYFCNTTCIFNAAEWKRRNTQ